MSDFLFLALGGGSFVAGIVVGMALYRLLWHVDTATLRAEIEMLGGYNRALQDESFQLRQAQDDLKRRLAVIEETNRELVRENREKKYHAAEIAKMVAGTN